MWSRKYPCCIKCSRTTMKHKGKGLCTSCYSMAKHSRRYHSDPAYRKKVLKNAKISKKKRMKDPAYALATKAAKKIHMRKYMNERYTNDPVFREKMKEASKKWHKEHYANDPVYRARISANTAKWLKKAKQDPVYLEAWREDMRRRASDRYRLKTIFRMHEASQLLTG